MLPVACCLDQCLKLPLAILSLHFANFDYNGRNLESLELFYHTHGDSCKERIAVAARSAVNLRIGNEDEQLTNYRYCGILIMPLGEAATE